LSARSVRKFTELLVLPLLLLVLLLVLGKHLVLVQQRASLLEEEVEEELRQARHLPLLLLNIAF
jgi:cell division protein FtsB